MTDLLDLYAELQNVLSRVTDPAILEEVDRQMSLIEDSEIALLKPAAIFAQYLPSDHDQEFRIVVMGARGHYVAHLVEKLYARAEVYWFVNGALDEAQYAGRMDYAVILEAGDAWEENGFSFLEKAYVMLREDAILLYDAKFLEGDAVLQNRMNCLGIAMEHMDSNRVAIGRKVRTEKIGGRRRAKYKKVYVVCPANVKTGGPELLHQMVYWMNALGGAAEISYVAIQEEGTLCHPELIGYVAGHLVRFEEIEDVKGNAVVVPEGWPGFVFRVSHADVYFWWLSVDNYVRCFSGKEEASRLVQRIDERVCCHLVQSQYAREYVLGNQIAERKIARLGDYVNQSYLDQVTMACETPKEDMVLYNPRKGAEYTARLREQAGDIHWVPIQNMTTQEVGELMRRAKVYVDFGNHPGKDRIPREAVLSGCVVITGRKGSAAYEEDVPIPSRYKMEQDEKPLPEVIKEIRRALEEYETVSKDFESYRERVLQEKAEFLSDLEGFFFD